MNAELAILDFIQAHLRNDVCDRMIPLITALGNGGAIWFGGALLLLLHPRTRKTAVVMIASLALEAICCNVILKPLIARTRPCDINTAVQLLIPHPSGFSFPSGHTGVSFAGMSVLYFKKSRLWKAAFVMAVMIAFSRLYLYVHYPSDVLAGIFIGIVCGRLSCRLNWFDNSAMNL